MTQKQTQPRATFTQRFIAYYLDLGIFGIVSALILYYISTHATDLQSFFTILTVSIIRIAIPNLCIQAIVQLVLVYRTGYTLGKAMTGIKTIADSKTLTFSQVLIREIFGQFVSWSVFGYGFWVILHKPTEKTWHDQLAGTNVYQVRNLTLLGAGVLITLVLVTTFLLQQSYVNVTTNTQLISDIRYILEPLSNL